MGDWIKCSERMPEYNHMNFVLVWCDNAIGGYSCYADWDSEKQEWWSDREEQLHRVTHWQPAPSKPEAV